MRILGIDEAGRGPVIGSMFIVGTLFEDNKLEELKRIGVKDSKLLIHTKRIDLAKKITKLAKAVKSIEVKPQEIDKAVEGDKSFNLNWLEAVKQCEIINELKPDRVIIDCPSPNISAYTNFLKKRIDKKLLEKLELVIEHKADLNYIECASASIIAKVLREEDVARLKKLIKFDFGSGYSSDPMTQEFIKENFKKHPEIFRKSWATFKNLNKQKNQKSLEDF